MMKRTTISVESDDLETLHGVARQRGISFSELMREITEKEARASRQGRRPKSIGIAKAGPGLSNESVDKEKDLTFLLGD